MSKKIVVLQTKGGVGKLFITKEVLPFWIARDAFFNGDAKSFPILLLEPKNSNEVKSVSDTYLESQTIQFIKNEKIDEKELTSVLKRLESDVNKNIILNLGGGLDSLSLIKRTSKLYIDDFVFVIPLLSDSESIMGAIKTKELLHGIEPNLKIVFVANKLDHDEEEELDRKKIIELFSKDDTVKKNKLDKLEGALSYVPEFSEEEKNLIESLPKSIVTYLEEALRQENPTIKEFTKKIKEELLETVEGEIIAETFIERKMQLFVYFSIFDKMMECEHLFNAISKH